MEGEEQISSQPGVELHPLVDPADKRKGVWPVILGAILLVILLGGGVFYYVYTQPGTPGQPVAAVTPTVTRPAASLKQPDADSPAAGVCGETTDGDVVTITINEDTPSPRCAKVSATQKIKVVNNTSKTVNAVLGRLNTSIEPGGEYTYGESFGAFLAPGVHFMTAEPYGGPEIWLQSAMKEADSGSQTYRMPAGWQEYSDNESGMKIYYPSQYTAKYNSNRGAGISYSAGSYLVDAEGKKVLDFYRYPYKSGSRRVSYYDAAEFDGPDDMSKYTVAAEDVVLNGKTYLKLVSKYWAGQEGGNRVFYFTTQNDWLYYFTYQAGLESNKTDYTNIQTIIATSVLSSGTELSYDRYIACYYRPDAGNAGDSWEARIENGDMVVTQRTLKPLKQRAADKSKISVSGNPQNLSNYFAITDFDVTVDSSKKGSYQDAFVIRIKKKDVDRIIKETPASIPSIAIITSISGGIETADGKLCKADLYGYYAPKP